MTDAVEKRIAEIILGHVEAMHIGSPPLPIANPDVKFVPPADGKYLRVTWLSGTPEQFGLSRSSTVLHYGILQITVCWPAGGGLLDPIGVAGQIVSHFDFGTKLYSAGLNVCINKKPGYASPIIGGSDVNLPVSIPWEAYAA